MMQAEKVLVYGAYGHTGRMIVASLIKNGSRPVLAGRDKVRLTEMAATTGLPWQHLDLSGHEAPMGVQVVVNAAGPFASTSAVLAARAIRQGCHYLDVANEPQALQEVYALDSRARAQGTVAVPGMGFGTVASNCLVQALLPRFMKPVSATICLAPRVTEQGAGTLSTMLRGVREGCCEVRDGHLVHLSGWQASKRHRLPFGSFTLAAAPLGDAVAAFRSAGIPVIRACIALPVPAFVAATALELGHRLLSVDAVYRRLSPTPRPSPSASPERAAHGRSRAWVCMEDADGSLHEAWMETGEGYAFTADSVAKAVRRLLDGPIGVSGALTPAMAFGASWLDEMRDTATRVRPVPRDRDSVLEVTP